MSENEMLEEIKSLSPSEEAILTMLIRYQNLKVELEKEKDKNKELESYCNDVRKEMKDKIKAIIEEQDKIINTGGIDFNTKSYARCKKEVLQSLLEKE